MISKPTWRMDVAAGGLSLACLIHCLVLPVAASLSPLIGSVVHAEWMHWVLLLLAAPVTVIALSGEATPVAARILAGAGMGGLLLGAAQIPAPSWEASLSVAGALTLAAAHGVNAAARLRKSRLRGERDGL